MKTIKLTLWMQLALVAAFGAGYAFDRWMHRPLIIPIEVLCSGTKT